MSSEAGHKGEVALCKLGSRSSRVGAEVAFSLTIQADFTWRVHLRGQEVSHTTCTLFADTPLVLTTTSDVHRLLESIDNSRVCEGNPDECYTALLPSRKGVFMDLTGM